MKNLDEVLTVLFVCICIGFTVFTLRACSVENEFISKGYEQTVEKGIKKDFIVWKKK